MDDKCNIVRDLMPLVIDEAASEDSVKFVEEHRAACGECAAYYQGMCTMLPRTAEADAEKNRFSRAAKKLRSRRRKRLAAWVCAGAVLIVLLLAGYQAARYQLTQVRNTPLRPEDYELTLSALENGRCVVTLCQADPAIEADLDVLFLPENGSMSAYFSLVSARMPIRNPSLSYRAQWTRCLFLDAGGLYYEENSVRMPVTRVFKGRPERCDLVYQEGKDVAPASCGMEQYFAQADEYHRLLSGPDPAESDTPAFQTRLGELHYQVETLEKLVPEWYSRPGDAAVLGDTMWVMMSPTLIPLAEDASAEAVTQVVSTPMPTLLPKQTAAPTRGAQPAAPDDTAVVPMQTPPPEGQ